MSELTNIHAREIKDLTTPANMPSDPNVFDLVKLVAGNWPVGYSNCEAVTLGQIKSLLNTGLTDKLIEETNQQAALIKQQLISSAEALVHDAQAEANKSAVSASQAASSLTSAEAKVSEANQIAALIIQANTGVGYELSEATLLASKPTVAQTLVQALDTNKTYLWTRTSAEGVTPVTGTWTSTGLSLYQQVMNLVENNPNYMSKTLTTRDLNTVIQSGYYYQSGSSNATAANNYPVQDAGFLRVDTVISSSTGNLTYGVQTYIPQLPTNATMYVRRWDFKTSTWQKWDTLITSEKAYEISTDIANRIKQYEVSISGNPKNLIDLSKLQYNKYVSSSGAVAATNDNWAVTHPIAVQPGEQYTLSGVFGHCAIAIFPDPTRLDAASNLMYERVINLPHTFTVPAGGNYAVINIYSQTAPNYADVQMEKGAAATAYAPGGKTVYIKKEFVLGIDALKPYEVSMPGSEKNLFKSEEMYEGYYLNTSGQLRTAAGWGASGPIPVTPGETYTVSGTFGYSGISFFASKDIALTTVNPIEYYPPFTAAKTVVAPPGAYVMFINLKRADKPYFSKVQVELGDTVTAYEDGDNFLGIKQENIYPALDGSQGGSVDTLSSTVEMTLDKHLIVKVKEEDATYTHKVRIQRDPNTDNSQVLNFVEDSLDGMEIKTMSDDVAPPRLDTATVGANHGYSRTTLTVANHGKTIADIGSIWVDEIGHDCILLDVVNANTLQITRMNANSSHQASQKIFTHKSGAVNTATINATTVTPGQWYPSIRKLKHKCFVDGKLLKVGELFTTVFKHEVVVLETYEILSRASMVQQHLNNKGMKLTDYENAQGILSVTNNYRFDTAGGITLETEYVALAAATLTDLMMIQAVNKQLSGGTSYFVPKTLPINVGGTTYDFDRIVSMTGTTFGDAITFTPAHTKANENAPDRVIQLGTNFGFALGFLPVLDAAYDVRKANTSLKTIYIPSHSLKVYPFLIAKGDTPINVGDVFAGVGYRRYFKRKADNTAAYPVYSRYGDFFYIHWHSSGLKQVELPEKLSGRKFTVSEKSSNVNVLSKMGGSLISAQVTSNDPSYLVLKFED